jgi:apolipoprotein N-acyltransferase
MAEDFEVGGPPPEESSNRTFLYAAGGIGLLILLSIGCLAGYALFLAPRQLEGRQAELTQIAAQNTQTSLEITQTAGARFPSPTTPPTRTPVPTNTVTPTRVVVVASATPTTVSATLDPAQQTAAALATLQALTPSPTVTALPTTGFADEGGFPALLVLAGALVLVVIVARRMRMRPVA